jgi:hypothetical protein
MIAHLPRCAKYHVCDHPTLSKKILNYLAGIIFYSGLSILLWMLCYMVTMAMRYPFSEVVPGKQTSSNSNSFPLGYPT